MNRKPHIYLAGPEVFLPNALEVADQKKRICADHGLTGVFPLDADLTRPIDATDPEFASIISASNENLMRRCDAIIANCTPFRGTGMDAGTAFELGFMRALGRPCFGYSNVPGDYAERARLYRAQNPDFPFEGDPPGTEIEDFGLPENLMIACAIDANGTGLITPDTSDAPNARQTTFADLTQFQRCVAKTAMCLSSR
ncbi:MAG: nucleoside 2-deoxyribosyltransferase [Pseudomonadota bacterium]